MSEEVQQSSSFELLHPKVQKWIWQQGWQELRDIQEISIPTLIEGRHDLIIAAATASGKTEAAFLPIVSNLAWAEMEEGEGFGALYISPLRALINDQFSRMESLCEEMDIPVVKWHGDASASAKATARKKPTGIVLITPESLEALLMRWGNEGQRYFSRLHCIVIDELHAFIDAPRGKQLQSLLHRIESMTGRRIPRVGLSATLSDMTIASSFLRPLDCSNVKVLQSASTGQELKLQVRGVIEPLKQDETPSTTLSTICDHMYKNLRGSRNLIFAGSRARVEEVTARLGDLCFENNVPNEFFAHHGSLSKSYREDAEQRMKEDKLPTSIVCTTTLELGIDIGNITSVAQIGAGHTVSGMRQRLGRSGRRAGQSSIFRIYTEECALTGKSHPIDALRLDTVQAIAMVELMLKRWNEPPNVNRLHLSTLVHQVLSLICQKGGLNAQDAWEHLIESGIFRNIDKPLFTQILKRMGHPEIRLLEQATDGTLLLGAEAEIITDKFDFYAVFETPEEFRVVFKNKEIGKLPMALPYKSGDLLIFGGRYWKVESVDAERHEIIVDTSAGGVPPKFSGDSSPQSDVVVAEMRRIYEGIDIPRYLDQIAISLLQDARKAYDAYDLRSKQVIPWNGGYLLFPWLGSAGLTAVILALMQEDLSVERQSVCISVKRCTQDALLTTLKKLQQNGNLTEETLASRIPEKKIDKYDLYLDEALQIKNFASAKIDVSRLQEFLSVAVEAMGK